MTQGAARYSHGETRNRITHNLFCPSGEFLIEIQRPCLSQANWVEQPDGLAVAPSFEDSARNCLSDSRPSLSGRRKANEERPNQVPTMMILVTAMFLLVLVLIALCLYVSGVFTNRRVFQFGFSILLVFFALPIGIGIGIQHFYEDYDCPATNPLNSAMGLQWRPSRALQMEVPGFFVISFETL